MMQEEIQQLYSVHRTRRNAQQKDKFLSPDFSGLIIDQHLLKLERPHIEPGFQDERNCLVLWARPPIHVIQLAEKLQNMLKAAAPGRGVPRFSFADARRLTVIRRLADADVPDASHHS